jgi:hypothetical protein
LVAIYFFEIEKSGTIGRNIVTISADIHLDLENGSWVIVGWFQHASDSNDMKYFQVYGSLRKSGSGSAGRI